MYLCKDAETTNGDLKTTYCSVKNMTHTTERVEGEVFMDNFFFTYTFSWPRNQQNKCKHDYSTQPKGCAPWLFNGKKLELKRVDIK